jgi:hypothetical protein
MSRNERFDEMLDEIYNHTVIGELSFAPSDILYRCDPIAYRVYLSDWMSDEEEDLEDSWLGSEGPF